MLLPGVVMPGPCGKAITALGKFSIPCESFALTTPEVLGTQASNCELGIKQVGLLCSPYAAKISDIFGKLLACSVGLAPKKIWEWGAIPEVLGTQAKQSVLEAIEVGWCWNPSLLFSVAKSAIPEVLGTQAFVIELGTNEEEKKAVPGAIGSKAKGGDPCTKDGETCWLFTTAEV
jgi:hypothetical protein